MWSNEKNDDIFQNNGQQQQRYQRDEYDENGNYNIINVKLELDYDKESELEQVINLTNEINIIGSATSSDIPITSSSSSFKFSSNSNSATNSLLSDRQKLQFCSSNSSLNTSFYEMNQSIDLAKNEYLAKTTLNSPNKYNNFNHVNSNIQVDLYINDANQTELMKQDQARHNIRLSQLYNNNINELPTPPASIIVPLLDQSGEILSDYNSQHPLEPSQVNRIDVVNNGGSMNCVEVNNDILLSNTLSFESSDNFLKTIDSITNTTATSSSTSTNDTRNCDMFLNIVDQNSQQNFFTHDFDHHYSHQQSTSDFNELLDKNFNTFETDLMLETSQDLNCNAISIPTNNNSQYSYSSNSHGPTNEFTMSRNSCLANDNDYLSITNNKHDVSIGTDLSISRDIRFKKDFNAIDHLKLKRPSEKESFKLVEKVQPKKSRTKYSKDQIEILENAYTRNPYPDVITVEQLCKNLDISREKVNIWFQNRRARTKRSNKVSPHDATTQKINNSNNGRTPNGYSKLFQNYQYSQHQQMSFNPYFTNQQYDQQFPSQDFISTTTTTTNSYPIVYSNSSSRIGGTTNDNYCLNLLC